MRFIDLLRKGTRQRLSSPKDLICPNACIKEACGTPTRGDSASMCAKHDKQIARQKRTVPPYDLHASKKRKPYGYSNCNDTTHVANLIHYIDYGEPRRVIYEGPIGET